MRQGTVLFLLFQNFLKKETQNRPLSLLVFPPYMASGFVFCHEQLIFDLLL